MGKVIVAALLGAAWGMPASAALVYEFTGPVTTSDFYPPAYSYPSSPAVQFTAPGSLSGQCAPPYCSDTVSTTGISWTGGYPGSTLIDFTFTFAAPLPATPTEGLFAGTSSGFYLTGNGLGTFYREYRFAFTQVRLFDDGERETPFSGTFSVAVPEPASWALMITGLALAGTSMRRSRECFAFARS